MYLFWQLNQILRTTIQLVFVCMFMTISNRYNQYIKVARNKNKEQPSCYIKYGKIIPQQKTLTDRTSQNQIECGLYIYLK